VADALLDKSLVAFRQQNAVDDAAFLRINALELVQHAKRDAHLKDKVYVLLLLFALTFILNLLQNSDQIKLHSLSHF